MTKKILITLSIIFSLFIALTIAFYLWFLPFVIKQNCVLDKIKYLAKNTLSLDVKIEKPYLKTYLKPKIYFSFENLQIKKNQKSLVELEDFEIYLSFEKIFKKRIKLKEINAKKLVLDTNEILKLIPKTSTSSQSDWFFDIFSASAKLDCLKINYSQNKTLIDVLAYDIFISNKNKAKTLYFNSKIDIKKENKTYLTIKALSQNEITITKNALEIKDFDLLINNSNLKINSKIDEKNICANLKSSNFKLVDIFSVINSDLVIPDGEKMLAVLANPKGEVKFDINYKNNNLDGEVSLNNTKANLKDLSLLPINIQSGKILIQKDKIDFLNLVGFWGKNKNNKIEILGNIKDYYKTFDTDITINTLVNQEFFRDYLAKLINNTELYLSKPQKAQILYKSKNNIMDIIFQAKISKGVKFGVKSDDDFKLSTFDRAIKGEFHIEDNNLDIKNINYYIAHDIRKGVKIQPVISVLGKMNLAGKIDNIGFSFDREIPCEFLNIFTNDKTFKKGTIKGNLFVKFKNDIPYLISNLTINKTLIPKERIFIKKAQLISDDNIIDAKIDGGFKRVKFNFEGKIKNELRPPFVVKNLTLDIDKIDVEKFMTSLIKQNDNTSNVQAQMVSEDTFEDDDYVFDTNLIIVEDCDFSLSSGKYKDLEFSNIKAKLTLDENGILNIQSNKFNIAQGISTLKFQSDLKNLKHYVRLGIKDVESNLMSKVFLNLENEISGLASGLIEINMDKTMKLNGVMKFAINNGEICKIGLVEYLLKMVSLFRNPIAVVNPATFADIISIPEGNFEKINGEIDIKDNVVNRIDIKSSANTMSALIRGKFDMERHDASIRVYTKIADKKTSIAFLRKLSLGYFANKVLLNSKNDENYYASELVDIPEIKENNDKAEIYLTQVEGDIERNNFISSLKKIK